MAYGEYLVWDWMLCTVVRVSADEKGNIFGLTPVGRCPVGCGLLAGPIISKKCKFAPYTVNSHATPYDGDVELVAP